MHQQQWVRGVVLVDSRTDIEPSDPRFTTVSNIQERKNRLTANNFIVGSSFTFLKNNQESIVDENFSQFRVQLEWVGNLLNAALNLGNAGEDEDGNRTIFNLAPSQYIKSELSYITRSAYRSFYTNFKNFGPSKYISANYG